MVPDSMEDTLTITLTPELKATLDNFTDTEGISPENLVQAAIQDYLFIRKFRALRSQLMQKAQTSYTDDDIFLTPAEFEAYEEQFGTDLE
jgi:predicted transcriptional regulator